MLNLSDVVAIEEYSILLSLVYCRRPSVRLCVLSRSPFFSSLLVLVLVLVLVLFSSLLFSFLSFNCDRCTDIGSSGRFSDK